ncbi:MAG: hypothetical protein H6839_00920 [Planctomycetes bacterium]|nr:hypothetical protein [Planctomycetota bacterium]
MFRLFVLCAVVFATPLCAATFNVSNLSNSGAGSLRQAITDHNSAGGTNTINFAVTGTVTVTSVLPTIASGNLTINANVSGNTVLGGGSNAVFAINSGTGSATVTINGLTISGGGSTAGSGLQVQAGSGGTTLNLNDCTISGNDSGAVLGLVTSTGTVTMNIDSCTFSGNTSGPALTVIASTGTAVANVTNSTFSGNSAPNVGGGITLANGGAANLVNCTITNNTATNGGGGISIPNGNGSSLTLQNTIVAGNTATTGPDMNVVSGNTLTSNDGNLIGVDSGFTMTAQANDQLGTTGSPLNPMLAALASNGGPTQTHALQTGSPAINAGVSGGPSVDQRGITRDAMPDIGAFERAGFLVTNLNDSGAGSLRQAILDHQSAGGTNTISFQSGLSGTITLATPISVTTGSLTIGGPGASVVTVSGNNSTRCFQLNASTSDVDLEIQGLTVANGATNTGGGVQVYIDDHAATLTLTDCTFTGHSSPSAGGAVGAILNSVGTPSFDLMASGCTFFANAASSAGGAINTGTSGGASGMKNATFVNCTFSGNTAAGDGGAIYANLTAVNIINCTFTGNSAANGGGIFMNASVLTMRNTIVAGNTATTAGPDINGSVTSNDGNLIGDNSGMTMTPQSNDQVGTSGSPIDPMLAALANNGGPTQTHALQAGSPAINAGVSGGPALDQRGVTRDANPDIGAYEFVGPELRVTYNSVVQTNGASNALTPSVAQGTPVNVTVNLANIAASGAPNLTITLPLTTSTLVNCTANVTTPPTASLAPGANSNLVLTLTPTAAGAYSAKLTINSNDAANSPFDLTFTGTALAPPQLQVTYNSTTQTSGATNPLTPDVQAGTPVAVTVNLANIASAGAGNLLVTLPLTVGAQTNCTGVVTTAPSASIAQGTNSDLVFTITPSAAGAYSVTLTIVSNDATNSPFTLTFTGNATASPGGGGGGGGGDGGGGCALGTGSGYLWLSLLGVLIFAAYLRRKTAFA